MSQRFFLSNYRYFLIIFISKDNFPKNPQRYQEYHQAQPHAEIDIFPSQLAGENPLGNRHDNRRGENSRCRGEFLTARQAENAKAGAKGIHDKTRAVE